MGTLISVADYLKTSYRADCDYIDGEIRERNPGEYDHSRMQMAIGVWLINRYKSLNRKVLPEQRVQVKPTRFRIADMCTRRGRAA
ncbi:MAG TPA: hypothetical protein VG273_15475 [Bryobacteraceae bacterium]|nr:hypothetical protein [Bryobacteraceae bacterium]